ncbi:MAG: hypothetical protein ACYCYI_05705 [Saccharofermentanales bacterium]
MFKKKLFLVEILILFSVFISLVNSFSITRADNAAVIKISSSAEALIAIPDNISIKIQKPFQESQIDSVDSLAIGAQIVENNFTITNNFIKTIQVHIDSDYEHINFSDFTIFSGETASVAVLIDDSTEAGIADIVITADWDDGYAAIEMKMQIEVV